MHKSNEQYHAYDGLRCEGDQDLLDEAFMAFYDQQEFVRQQEYILRCLEKNRLYAVRALVRYPWANRIPLAYRYLANPDKADADMCEDFNLLTSALNEVFGGKVAITDITCIAYPPEIIGYEIYFKYRGSRFCVHVPLIDKLNITNLEEMNFGKMVLDLEYSDNSIQRLTTSYCLSDFVPFIDAVVETRKKAGKKKGASDRDV